jgi:hypothetical protein
VPVKHPQVPSEASFPSQSDAESWIGEEWRSLLDAGVDQVVLVEDGTIVYGPMSLHPAE